MLWHPLIAAHYTLVINLQVTRSVLKNNELSNFAEKTIIPHS